MYIYIYIYMYVCMYIYIYINKMISDTARAKPTWVIDYTRQRSTVYRVRRVLDNSVLIPVTLDHKRKNVTWDSETHCYV